MKTGGYSLALEIKKVVRSLRELGEGGANCEKHAFAKIKKSMERKAYIQQLEKCGLTDAAAEQRWNGADKTHNKILRQCLPMTDAADGQARTLCFPLRRNQLILLHLLGQGQESSVYLGCAADGATLAIKIMLDDEQAAHETEIHQQLSDLGLAPHLRGSYTSEGTFTNAATGEMAPMAAHFIESEQMDRTLDEALEDPDFVKAHGASVYQQLDALLQSMVDHGYIQGDLHDQNFILKEMPGAVRVYIIDFGDVGRIETQSERRFALRLNSLYLRQLQRKLAASD